jgi:hypothetical protein
MAAEKLEIIIHAKDQFSRTMKSLGGMLPNIKTLAIGAGAAIGGLGTGLFAIANSTAKAGDEYQKRVKRMRKLPGSWRTWTPKLCRCTCSARSFENSPGMGRNPWGPFSCSPLGVNPVYENRGLP